MMSGVLALVAVAGWLVQGDTPFKPPPEPKPAQQDLGKFTFVRVEYDSVGGYGEAHYVFDRFGRAHV